MYKFVYYTGVVKLKLALEELTEKRIDNCMGETETENLLGQKFF